MAEEEAVVNADLEVSDGEEVAVSVMETEQEAPEVPEKATPEDSIEVAMTRDAPDNKRKLEDLEPLDEAPAKKQQICGLEPNTEDLDPSTEGLDPNTEALDPNTEALDPSTESSASAEDLATAALEVVAPDIGTQETEGSGFPTMENPVVVDGGTMLDPAQDAPAIDGNLEERLCHDEEPDGIGLIHVKVVEGSLGNGQIQPTDDIQHAFAKDEQHPSSSPLQDDFSLSNPDDLSSSTHKIDVPNDKVGVLIGKYGETIKYLQINSGAKIQITRDTDVDPYSTTRTVELIGTLESINKAEELIKNVIAEADAGGSPALVAKGFSALQSGDEQIEIQVPNEKVGKIIGKGGETIKNIQTKSGARVQLIPQHLPKGDVSKERTVRITGNKKQVELAKEMIKEIMNQIFTRTSNTFRPPRGSAPAPHWGPRSTIPTQPTTAYNHQQRGMYPPTQYHQSYGGYSQQQQPPPRGPYGSGWVQPRPTVSPMQPSPQPGGGYDYYNQGGPIHSNQPSNPVPGSAPSSAPTNFNYYQQQSQDAYGHSASYAQPPSVQQLKYGHGYNNEPKYDTQPPVQQTYAQQQPMGPQSGMHGPQSAAPYGKPVYGAPHEASRMAQPGDQMYQGVPQNQYPSSNVPMQQQQQYPYTSNAPGAQQEPPYIQQTYGPTSSPADGYGGYSQPAPGYAQGGQAVPAYSGQPVPQPGGYGQYPSQPSYGDQPAAQSNVNYGYQGGAPPDAATYAGSVPPNTGYAAQTPVAGQPPPYSQTPVNPSGYYDQSMAPQYGVPGAPVAAPGSAIAAAPGAPVAYANSVSPQQPAYGGQYESAPAYSHH